MAEEVKFIFSMDDHFSNQAKKAEASVSGLETKLNQLGGAVAAAFSVGAIVNFGKEVIQSYSKYEMFNTALTTMLQGNANEAEALNSRLINLAKTTPFELTEVQDATKQLLAFGSSAGKVESEIRTLGDVSAGIGAPIKDIAYLYGTVRTQGRAMTQDINQFANRGIPIWKELEKITGKSGLALRKLVEEGKVGFPQIQQVMANLTKEGGQFFNLMDAQSKTLGGQISNLNDSWEQFKVNLGTTFADNVKEALGFLSESLNGINQQLATSNRLQKNLKQSGVALKYGQIGAGAEMVAFQEMLEKQRDEKTSDVMKMVKLQQYAKMITDQHNEALKSGKTNYDENLEYIRKISLIRGEIEHYKGEIQLGMSKAKDAKAALDQSTSSAKGTKTGTKESAKVKQQQYTNITINIDKLVEDFTVETNTMEQGATGAKEQVVKALIEAVNNSQVVAGI